MLTERQNQILKTIVQEYSETAIPVSSGLLIEKYHLLFSSATLRAEMARLEELGFLTQPHISAGRIPSDKGYRYFIDNLIVREKTDLEYQKRLELELLKLKTKNARLERTTAKLLSSMSHCLAISGVVNKDEFYDFGMHNLLEDPELAGKNDLSRLVMALDVIDENLDKIVSEMKNGETKIFVGGENPIEAAKNCSMIVSPYQRSDGERGLLAIIGPRRMKYQQNKGLIDLMRKMLGKGNQMTGLVLILVINFI
jgi:heat-inducible transcriptional repressor